MYCISSRVPKHTMVVGKVKFDRKVFGRMTKQRKNIENKTGIDQLDFEPFSDTMEVRATGIEESVSRALILVIKLAEGCGCPPSNGQTAGWSWLVWFSSLHPAWNPPGFRQFHPVDPDENQGGCHCCLPRAEGQVPWALEDTKAEIWFKYHHWITWLSLSKINFPDSWFLLSNLQGARLIKGRVSSNIQILKSALYWI